MYVLNKKFKIFLNYFVGPLLFAWLSVSIYNQIKHQQDVRMSWEQIRSVFVGPQLGKFCIVCFLMFVNLGFEARKWQILVSSLQKVSFWKAYRSVFAGQAVGFNTLNGVGTSAGRVLFLKEGNRLRGIVLSVVGSMSQVIVTFLLGLISLLYLRNHVFINNHSLDTLSVFWYDSLLYVIGIGIVCFILLYFRLSWFIQILEKIPFIAKYKFFVQKLEAFHWKELTRLLMLSFCRYVVFLVQYVLLLQVFEVNIAVLDAASLVSAMFLILAIMPTISLAELGFRGKLSLQLLSMLSPNAIGIVATAAGIWMINLMIPAIAGSLFILGIRLFRNNK